MRVCVCVCVCVCCVCVCVCMCVCTCKCVSVVPHFMLFSSMSGFVYVILVCQQLGEDETRSLVYAKLVYWIDSSCCKTSHICAF